MSSEGDAETGSVILGISDRLVAAMVPATQNQTKKVVQSPTVGKRICLLLRLYGLHLNSLGI